MTPQEITEGNKLIAEFMDISNFKLSEENNMFLVARNCPLVGWFNYSDLKYHSSWDWLIPVIRKAKQSRNSAEWGWNVLNLYLSRCEIENVLPEVVEFIKWHNQNKAQ